MTLTTETLQRFCATINDPRDYLQKPFRQAGMIYATNGHFFVEIPDDGRELVHAPESRLPKVKTIIDKLKAAEFFTIPESEMNPCSPCHGAGVHSAVECESCDGQGEFEHYGHNYDCAPCNGTGRIGSAGVLTTCLRCDGIGEAAFGAETTRVGGALFATRYLRFLVRMLPGPVTIAVSGARDPAEFRFAGGRGVLMPVVL